MRLEKAGAIKVFTDVMSGKSMERPGLAEPIAYARKGDWRPSAKGPPHRRVKAVVDLDWHLRAGFCRERIYRTLIAREAIPADKHL